jgi:glycerophosphoryl diester phosphodiesterase
LDQVLDLTKGLEIINIEIKGIGVRSNGVELAVAEAILRFRLLRKVVVSSFNPAILLRLQQLNPAIRRGLLVYDRSPLTLRRYWSAPMLRTFSIHPSISLLKKPKVEQAHRERKMVYSWTVNHFPELEMCINMNVDGIITDDPGWLHAALGGS